MPSPFPGMDPYLEQSIFWQYYVEVETRTYQSDDQDWVEGLLAAHQDR
jgi:hypothetical protein